jgi:Arc/MetJ family transcription regulator
MRAAIKATKTFSLDRDILANVKRTKGTASESERVNQLLRTALDLEMKKARDREAADFFAETPKDRQERRAFQKAALNTLARE